jgi:hypothetical protein
MAKRQKDGTNKVSIPNAGLPETKAAAPASRSDGAEAPATLTCQGFKLSFYQNWTYTSFQIQVKGSDNADYVLATANIPGSADLIAGLLAKIADARGETGWTFFGRDGLIVEGTG